MSRKRRKRKKDRPPIPPQPQRYVRDKVRPFLTYTSARMVFNTLDAERKRIRQRVDGTFDLVTYKRISVKTESLALDENPSER